MTNKIQFSRLKMLLCFQLIVLGQISQLSSVFSGLFIKPVLYLMAGQTMQPHLPVEIVPKVICIPTVS